jgi:hypothetical protein
MEPIKEFSKHIKNSKDFTDDTKRDFLTGVYCGLIKSIKTKHEYYVMNDMLGAVEAQLNIRNN